ncbi:MAG: DUF3880 domain-containing protein [bacterium]|nr:DUF3880 domain-containing protein [bacterium]
MKLLFYRYGSICEPDIIEGFEELGLTVLELSPEMYDKQMKPSESVSVLSEYLFANPVEFVFSINFFPTVAEVCHIFHLPYLCWIVDSPVLELYAKAITYDTNRIFLFDRALYNEISSFNPECVFHLPLATNVRQKDALLSSVDAQAKNNFSCDVSFIGSLYTEKNPLERLPDTPNYLRGYLDGLMEAQLQVYGYFFVEEVLPEEIVSEFADVFPGFYRMPGEHFLTDRTTMAQLYIGTQITVLERQRAMRLLSERFPVTIYTGSDTSGYPRLINKGFAKTLTEMPVIFHESNVNLNLTAKSIRSGLPLRIWDILGSGGFCLTNYQPELTELLAPGEYLDCYTSLDDLAEKVDYYRSHETVRKEIARAGYEFVKAYHTYPVRLTRMLELAFGL